MQRQLKTLIRARAEEIREEKQSDVPASVSEPNPSNTISSSANINAHKSDLVRWGKRAQKGGLDQSFPSWKENMKFIRTQSVPELDYGLAKIEENMRSREFVENVTGVDSDAVVAGLLFFADFLRFVIKEQEAQQKEMDGPILSQRRIKPPARMDVSQNEIETMIQFQDQLRTWGFVIEQEEQPHSTTSKSFVGGLTTVLLTHAPVLCGAEMSVNDLRMFLLELNSHCGSFTRPPAVTRILNNKACRGAIMVSPPHPRDF